MTLDELISALEDARGQVGGHAPVWIAEGSDWADAELGHITTTADGKVVVGE